MNTLENFAEFLIRNAESISKEIVNYSLKNLKLSCHQN